MGVSYNPRIVTDGLVFCVDAANKRSYPGAGTTWTDLTANKNNGTLTNGPTFDSANGGSIVFDGNDDYVDFNPVTFPSTYPYSMCCWFRSNDTSDTRRTFFAFGNTGDDNYFILIGLTRYTIDGPYVRFGVRSGNGAVTSNGQGTINVQDGKWHEAILVATAKNDFKFYTDGILDVTDTTDLLDNTFTMNTQAIGRLERSSPEQYYIGNVAIARFYNRALSAEEIRQNYKATKGRFEV
jgi:hypothetical protein